MQLQCQPSNWSCVPTAAAMVVGMPVNELMQLIGHDGGELYWPGHPDRLERHRSFHPEEVQAALLGTGWLMTCFISCFEYAPDGYPYREWSFSQSLTLAMTQFNGMLLGWWNSDKLPHAVAWNARERAIYDPRGAGRVVLDGHRDFHTLSFWAISKFKC